MPAHYLVERVPNTSLQRTRRQSLRSFLLAAELDIVRPQKTAHEYVQNSIRGIGPCPCGLIVSNRLPTGEGTVSAVARPSDNRLCVGSARHQGGRERGERSLRARVGRASR